MEKTIDGAALRTIMRNVPSAVTVVTAAAPGEMRGITIGSFTSVSMSPPLISFNVQREAQMHDLITTTSRFAVHLLGEGQSALSDHFAHPDRSSAEQFEQVSFDTDEHGIPVLEGAVAVIHCTPYAHYEAGDHTIVVGEVVKIENQANEKPVLYYNRAYWSIGAPVRERS